MRKAGRRGGGRAGVGISCCLLLSLTGRKRNGNQGQGKNQMDHTRCSLKENRCLPVLKEFHTSSSSLFITAERQILTLFPALLGVHQESQRSSRQRQRRLHFSSFRRFLLHKPG